MALLAYQQLASDGTQPTFSAVANGDTVPWDPYGYLEVVNGGGSADNVTITPPGTIHGANYPTLTVQVNAGATKKIKLTADMVNPATGLITIGHSFITSVTCAALRVAAG